MNTNQTINNDWCKNVFEEAKNDPTLLSTIDVDAILNKIENDGGSYLENKTLADNSKEIMDVLKSIDIPDYLSMNYCIRLAGYRVVDKICDLRNGRMMRWIKKANKALTNGGILMNIKIENNGVHLLCRNSASRFFNIKFDDCLVFQKLTMEEQIILMSTEYAEENTN